MLRLRDFFNEDFDWKEEVKIHICTSHSTFKGNTNIQSDQINMAVLLCYRVTSKTWPCFSGTLEKKSYPVYLTVQ